MQSSMRAPAGCRNATEQAHSTARSLIHLKPRAVRAGRLAAGPNGVREKMQTLGGAMVTDDAVPEGHKGLHGFLYGEDGASMHDGNSNYEFRRDEDDGSVMLPVTAYLEKRDGEKPLGVYQLYDVQHNIQYVGYSRNMVLAIKAHLDRVGEERCAFVRAMVFANRGMATRRNLEIQASQWLDEAGTTPPGNGVEQELWDGKVFDTRLMSETELLDYEDKKTKMRKAMGENLGDKVEGEDDTLAERRLKMIKAMEGDDWSAVIDGQTQETRKRPALPAAAASSGAAGPATAAPEAAAPVASPFSRASVHRSIGGNEAVAEVAPEMTPEAVNSALDEVRPYLIADGGNVEVVAVERGVVMLRLQGACGTCPSSTATMKMGIERSLRSKFGDQLLEVMQLDKVDVSASVASINEHLDQLRPAIAGLGGSVDVVSVEGGVCEVRYVGPSPLGQGIKAAIKDKFPDVREVKLFS